jgi:hypothetical protein
MYSCLFLYFIKKYQVYGNGHSLYGGNSSNVKDQLRKIKKIYSNNYAFAAINNDGDVIT